MVALCLQRVDRVDTQDTKREHGKEDGKSMGVQVVETWHVAVAVDAVEDVGLEVVPCDRVKPEAAACSVSRRRGGKGERSSDDSPPGKGLVIVLGQL